jgi:hypothetical protein
MNCRTLEHEHRPEEHKRRVQTLEDQTLELRTLELRIASGEHLQDVLEECAWRLSAMELSDAWSEN